MLIVLTLQRTTIWHDSLTLWNDVISKYPAVAEAYANRGIARMKYEDVEGAIQDCDRSLGLNRANAPALTCRGLALYKKSEGERNQSVKNVLLNNAAADLRLSLEMVPDQQNERICLGRCNLDLGNIMEALRQFRIALIKNPRNADVLNNIGFCLFRLNQPDSVLFYCSQAIEIDPKCAPAWGNMGLAHQQKGEYQKAAMCYEEAIRINPRIDPAYIRNCAGIYEFLKDMTKANYYSRMLR
jgi:tetratricopeptide (TPR) repeat protein